ncbi:response regulator transcription factor [bacterium]|nr:MAG: response regulator transcription factor [bacterium]
MRLLLLEDSDTDAAVLAAAVRAGLGPQAVVERFTTLQAACEAAARGGWTAALVDLTVDDSLGLTTLARLREKAPGLPILVVSGERDEIIREEALAAGAKAFLLKGSLQPAALAAAVNAALS